MAYGVLQGPGHLPRVVDFLDVPRAFRYACVGCAFALIELFFKTVERHHEICESLDAAFLLVLMPTVFEYLQGACQ